MRRKMEYYDAEIDVEKILMESGAIDDLLRFKDLKQRKLFLDSTIDEFTASYITKHILQFNAEDRDISIDKRKPIILYIASNGGEINPGMELIDAILSSKTPVYTVNRGYQYSMGFLVGLAGHKRFAMPNAQFLMHDGANFIYNSGAKAQDQMEFNRRLERRIKNYVLNRSNLTEAEYDEKLRVEWYLFAQEAAEKGFVDYIIGVDCDIDTII